MSHTTITVWYDGQALLIFESVAEMLNLKDGQQIRTEKEFWKILGQNAEVGIASCKQMLTPEN